MKYYRISRYLCAGVLALLGAATLEPARVRIPQPNQPILLLQDRHSPDPYQKFIPELLNTEGLKTFEVAQIADATSDFLCNYDVVILPHLAVNAAQEELFRNYVHAGGTLIAFRPDLRLAHLFGVNSLGSTLNEAWLKIDTATPYSSALDSPALKFHGVADLYSLHGATSPATLAAAPGSPTPSPAVAINRYGMGNAILFSFDLTQSIVLMRQGNPAWAGYPNTHDGFRIMRASQMFMDKSTGKFWNDLGDGALNDVPQADIELRLLSNLIMVTSAEKRPLPRLWYFPDDWRSLLLFTGDHHGDKLSNSLDEMSTVQSHGGTFSEFVWNPLGKASATHLEAWRRQGLGMGLHFNDTAEVDSSGAPGSQVSWSGVQSVIATAVSSFKKTFPAAPVPVVARNHFLIWLSRDATGKPDPIAQVRLFQDHGIQMDMSYCAFPRRWGYMNGSGLPMKFLDIASGATLPVYEQATQYEDDIQLGNGPYGLNWNLDTAAQHYRQTLSESATRYNVVTTVLFHPDQWNNFQTYAKTILQYAREQHIPMSTTNQWLCFWKGREATSLSTPTFVSGVLTFKAGDAPEGLTLLVPDIAGHNTTVTDFRVDGRAQKFNVARYQGVQYASVILHAGRHDIAVRYGSNPALSTKTK